MYCCWCSKADLVVCRGLQHLDVSSNQLQAATCAALGHVISTSCQLQHLRLDLNPLGKQVRRLILCLLSCGLLCILSCSLLSHLRSLAFKLSGRTGEKTKLVSTKM